MDEKWRNFNENEAIKFLRVIKTKQNKAAARRPFDGRQRKSKEMGCESHKKTPDKEINGRLCPGGGGAPPSFFY
jgi:hypothetical protein